MAQVDECNISFFAKITSVSKRTKSDAIGFNANFGAQIPNIASVTASYSTQRKSDTSTSDSREFSLKVAVKAKQSGKPDGMRRLMDIFEQAVMVKDKV